MLWCQKAGDRTDTCICFLLHESLGLQFWATRFDRYIYNQVVSTNLSKMNSGNENCGAWAQTMLGKDSKVKFTEIARKLFGN